MTANWLSRREDGKKRSCFVAWQDNLEKINFSATFLTLLFSSYFNKKSKINATEVVFRKMNGKLPLWKAHFLFQSVVI